MWQKLGDYILVRGAIFAKHFTEMLVKQSTWSYIDALRWRRLASSTTPNQKSAELSVCFSGIFNDTYTSIAWLDSSIK